MPKPRRKHIGFNSLVLSPHGRQFIRFLTNTLGDDFSYEPVASSKDGFHIFSVAGEEHAPITLVEGPTRLEHGLCVTASGFRQDIPDPPVVIQVEVVTHRFDPWVHAEHSGDRSVLELTPHHRRKETDRRSEEIGAAADLISFRIMPRHEAPDELAGLAWDRVEQLVAEQTPGGEWVDEFIESLREET